MAELITVPTMTFHQDDSEGQFLENPLQVQYYNGTICIEQKDTWHINISPELAKKFFREVLKHMPEAEAALKRKS